MPITIRQEWAGSLAHDVPEHLTICAQAHAYADFPGALSDAVADHAINTMHAREARGRRPIAGEQSAQARTTK